MFNESIKGCEVDITDRAFWVCPANERRKGVGLSGCRPQVYLVCVVSACLAVRLPVFAIVIYHASTE